MSDQCVEHYHSYDLLFRRFDEIHLHLIAAARFVVIVSFLLAVAAVVVIDCVAVMIELD